MRKTLERCNKAIKRLGNEGFSLVELIIVIAIMVALVAVLAPQYFQYVEKSRRATDASTAKEILSGVKVVTIDPDMDIGTDEFKIMWDSNDSGAISFQDAPTGFADALFSVLGTQSIAPQSNFAKGLEDDFTITVSYDGKTSTNPNGTNAYVFEITPEAWAVELGVDLTTEE